jgi:hypothetical protein
MVDPHEASSLNHLDPFHTSNDWLVSDVRRVHLQDLGSVGEIFVSRHRIHRNFRRRFHIHGYVNLAGYRLAPTRRGKRQLLCQFDLTRPPGLGEPRFERAVEP